MGLLAGAWTEALLLHRVVRFWWVAGCAVWLTLVRVTEPPGLRRSEVPFYWAAAESSMLLTAGLVPLLWVLMRRPSTTAWVARTSRRPTAVVLWSWLGVASYATAGATLCAAVALTVDSIFGAAPAPLHAAALVLEALCLLAPLAALAPAAASVGLPAYAAVVVWLAILVGSFTRGFPVPTGALLILQHPDPTMAPSGPSAALATALATAGSLALSTGLARKRS